MKYLMIQFSDGYLHHGVFDLYRVSSVEYSWRASSKNDLMRYDFENIKPKGCNFIYNKSAIVKFDDVTQEEFSAYQRDGRIDTILSERKY